MDMAEETKTPGRERKTGRFNGYFRPSTIDGLNTLAAKNRMSVNAVVEMAVEQLISRGDANAVTLRLYHTAPCGEWQDANAEEVSDFELSPNLVQLWGVHQTDMLMATRGCSMLEVGIPEEAILHIRPFGYRAPRAGQVCVVTAVNLDTNQAWGTIKKWGHDGHKVVLRDGKNNKLEMPEGAQEVHAVGYWTGNVIGVAGA
jgi:SOS-response transcriptional repressor LexA